MGFGRLRPSPDQDRRSEGVLRQPEEPEGCRRGWRPLA